MAYEAYATTDYYLSTYNGTSIPAKKLEQCLRTASRHIDSLTYNRIIGQGFLNLTEFQRDIIQEVICLQADFEYENLDILDNILNSYSINGVSMNFNGQSWNIFSDKGIAIRKDVYALLSQTGLTCRLVVGK